MSAGLAKYKTALDLIRKDSVGDWIHDPWGMPELAWLVQRPDDLQSMVRQRRQPGYFSSYTVIKENYGIRPAVHFQPLDRLIYESSLLPLLAKKTGNLPEAVCGYRWDPGKRQTYVDNGDEWKRYRQRLTDLCAQYPCVLKTDISSFFASIPNEVLKSQLETCVGEAADEEEKRNTQKALTWLEGYWNKPNRRGLPQRYWASNVIANLVVGSVDAALGHRFPNCPYARWVDDFVFFSKDASELRKLQIWLAEQLHELGLSLNLAKTKLFEGDAAAGYYKTVDHTELARQIGDGDPLEHLEPVIESLKNEPHLVSRTDVKFFLKLARRRDLEEFARIFLDKTGSLLHASDLLANSFAYFGLWSDCQQWFVDFSKQPLASCSWVVGQLIRMFPPQTQPSKEVVERISELVATGSYSERVSALFLLSRWDRGRGRSVLRDCIDRFHSHDDIRLAAFIGADIKEEKSWIRRIVNQTEELNLLQAYLADRDFAPAPVHPYYVVEPREQRPEPEEAFY